MQSLLATSASTVVLDQNKQKQASEGRDCNDILQTLGLRVGLKPNSRYCSSRIETQTAQEMTQ